jgi:hypothetical protein
MPNATHPALADGKLSLLQHEGSLPYSSDPLVVANAGYGVIVRGVGQRGGADRPRALVQLPVAFKEVA